MNFYKDCGFHLLFTFQMKHFFRKFQMKLYGSLRAVRAEINVGRISLVGEWAAKLETLVAILIPPMCRPHPSPHGDQGFIVPPPPSTRHHIPFTVSGRHVVSSRSSPPRDLQLLYSRCGREWNRAVAGGDDRIRRGRRIRLSRTQHRPHAAGAINSRPRWRRNHMLFFRSLFCVWFVSFVKLVFFFVL
jgi:hypothetical protein